MRRPPCPAPPEGIVVHETMQLGGVRFHHLRGVAVGFDEAGAAVCKTDLNGLSSRERERLKRLLAEVLADLERNGAGLH